MSRIVVVGGGAAGLELVTRLSRQFRAKGEHEVVLVERASCHYWKPRLHEVAAGSFDTELDAVRYSEHAACSGYRYVQATMFGLGRDNENHMTQGSYWD